MAPAISDFSGWATQMKGSGAGDDLVAMLNHISRLARDRFGAHLRFARIMGRRWSYIAGDRDSPSDTRLVTLKGGYGMVIGDQGALAEPQVESLVETLNCVLAHTDKETHS